MKIGVTGASGHIGANVVRAFEQTEHKLRVLQFNGNGGFNGLNLDVHRGSLLDEKSLLSFCEGLDVVIHLAAIISIGDHPYEELFNTNVNGTKNLVNACKKSGVKRFIHFSSIHALIHEPLDEPMDENKALATSSPIAYEKTKAIAEAWVLEQHSEGFDVVVLSPTAVLGPNDFGPSLVGQFIIRMFKNTIPGLLPGGYDWVDVRDIANATIAATEKGRGGERYILSGSWLSLVDFAALLEKISGKSLRKLVFPFGWPE